MRQQVASRKEHSDKVLRRGSPAGAAPWQRAAQPDPHLASVINAWDRLPAAVRAGIVAMVKAVADGYGGR